MTDGQKYDPAGVEVLKGVQRTRPDRGHKTLTIDPDLVTFHDPKPSFGYCVVSYRGVVVPGMFRTPDERADGSTQRHDLARRIEERLDTMSAHARQAFISRLNGD